MFPIPQSTSFVAVFKAYLSSDHVTEATGKTIAITISKAGGAFGNPNAGATNATEISSGWYKVTLDTTDTATLGILALRGTAATIDDIGDRFFVVSASTGGLTNLDATVSSRLATSGYTAPSNLTAAQIATGIWQDTTAGDFTTALSVGKSIMNGVSLGTGLTVASVSGAVGSVTGAVGSVTGSIGSVASGGITAASIAADAITAAKIADGAIDAATFASGALDAVWSTAARVLTAGTNIQLPANGLANVTAWTVAITGNITGNLSGSVGSVTTVSDKTGYSLTQSFPANFAALGIGAGGHISNVDTLTTYTGDTPQTGDAFARVGAAGAGLTALGDTRIAHLDADVSSRSTYAGADTSGTTTLLGRLTSTRAGLLDHLDADVSSRLASGSYTAPDNSDIAAIKLQTDKLTFTVANQIDANVLDWKSATAPAMTGDAFARLGSPAGASVSADIAAVKAVDDAVKAKTDNLPASPADESLIIAATNALATSIAALPTTSTVMSADIKKVNGVTVNGDGAGTPWGP